VLLAASGGIAALVVAFATILPELELTASIFFVVPVKLKAKHFGYALWVIGIFLLVVDRNGVVSHSSYLGGCAAGWLYAHLLGFGRPSLLQRLLRQRRLESERRRQMSLKEFIAEDCILAIKRSACANGRLRPGVAVACAVCVCTPEPDEAG